MCVFRRFFLDLKIYEIESLKEDPQFNILVSVGLESASVMNKSASSDSRMWLVFFPGNQAVG